MLTGTPLPWPPIPTPSAARPSMSRSVAPVPTPMVAQTPTLLVVEVPHPTPLAVGEAVLKATVDLAPRPTSQRMPGVVPTSSIEAASPTPARSHLRDVAKVKPFELEAKISVGGRPRCSRQARSWSVPDFFSPLFLLWAEFSVYKDDGLRDSLPRRLWGKSHSNAVYAFSHDSSSVFA
jgi:hypothetical protein